jgi:hypothetical protein
MQETNNIKSQIIMKQKLLLAVSIIFLLQAENVFSQNFILYGDRTFGGDKNDDHPLINFLGLNQLILSGESFTNANGDKTDPLCSNGAPQDGDIWILTIDTTFNIHWNESIGGTYTEVAPQTKIYGNEIIFSCFSTSDSSCEKSQNHWGNSDYWICAIDTSGNKLWDKNFGSYRNDYSPEIIRLTSGDYIVAGTSDTSVSGDKTVLNYGNFDYWLLKLDSAGNKLWDKVYGGTGLEKYFGINNFTIHSFSVIPTLGNNFILAGTTSSPASGAISDTSRGADDIWLVKLDSSGNKIWDKRYGGSTGDMFAHIIPTNDGGYILCGSTQSPQGLDVSDTSRGDYDVWVIKIDSLGNKQWDKRYGGNLMDLGSWIEKAPEGGYWVSGTIYSDSSSEVSEPSYGQMDYWIFKIDSAGNKIWDKRFGAYGVDVSTSFIIMPDSSIFLCGSAEEGISAVKSDYGKGLADYWLVHFKYADSNTGISENEIKNNSISIYPNPTKGVVKINNKYLGDASISVYNLIGEKIYQAKINLQRQNTFNFSELQTGMYFMKIKNEKISSTIKFIKE